MFWQEDGIANNLHCFWVDIEIYSWMESVAADYEAAENRRKDLDEEDLFRVILAIRHKRLDEKFD